MAIVDHIRSTDTLGRMDLLALKAQLAGGGAHLEAVVRAIDERILALDADRIRDAYNDDERYRNHAKVTMHVDGALFFESPIRHSSERTSAELSRILKL